MHITIAVRLHFTDLLCSETSSKNPEISSTILSERGFFDISTDVNYSKNIYFHREMFVISKRPKMCSIL